MVSNEEIEYFINKIPPTPKALKEALQALDDGELNQAATAASSDPALSHYLITLVNRPYFNVANTVHDAAQVISMLGLVRAREILYTYLLSLLSPKSWQLFSLNKQLFLDLQAILSEKYKIILHHLNITDSDIASAIALLPAAIIVTEALFKAHIDEITLLRASHQSDFNTLLKQLTNRSLFDLCESIATTWEMPLQTIAIIKCASGVPLDCDKTMTTIAQWMHLLLFYVLSKPEYVQAGLNDFLTFQPEFVASIQDEFFTLMEIS